MTCTRKIHTDLSFHSFTAYCMVLPQYVTPSTAIIYIMTHNYNDSKSSDRREEMEEETPSLRSQNWQTSAIRSAMERCKQPCICASWHQNSAPNPSVRTDIQKIPPGLDKAEGPFTWLYSLEVSQHWWFNVFFSKSVSCMSIFPFSLRFQKSWHC